MAEHLDETPSSPALLLAGLLVLAGSKIKKYNLPPTRKTILELLSIAYNTVIPEYTMTTTVLDTFLTRCEQRHTLIFTAQGLEILPLSALQVEQMLRAQKIPLYIAETLFDRLLSLPYVLPEIVLEIVFTLALEYGQKVAESQLHIDSIALVTEKAKKTIIQETWKDLHEDFELMYEVLSENTHLYTQIHTAFFYALEYLHEVQEFLLQNSKIVDEQI